MTPLPWSGKSIPLYGSTTRTVHTTAAATTPRVRAPIHTARSFGWRADSAITTPG